MGVHSVNAFRKVHVRFKNRFCEKEDDLMFTCSECGEEIPDAVLSDPLDLTMDKVSGVARQCSCGWTCCFRCDPTYDQSENGHECPKCKKFRQGFIYYDPHIAQVNWSGWIPIDGYPRRWREEGLYNQWKNDQQSDRWTNIRIELATRLGVSASFIDQARKATTWEQLASAFSRFEAPKDKPNFEGLLDEIDRFGSNDQQGIWVSIAEKFRSLNKPFFERYAYSEALVALPTSSSVAWYWLYKLLKEYRTSGSDSLVNRMIALDLTGARPGNPDDFRTIPELASEIKAFAQLHIEQIPEKDVYSNKQATLEKKQQVIKPKRLSKPRVTVGSGSLANFGKIVGAFIGLVFTFSGIMSLASSIILAKIGTNLIFGPGALVCGVLSIFSVFSFRKRKNRKGGLLLISGLLIFVITIIVSIFLESP